MAEGFMGMPVLRRKDVESWDVNDQLKFYKDKFQGLHCECSRELSVDWVKFDGELMCERCYDFLVEKKERDALDEVEELEKRLQSLKDVHDVGELKEKYEDRYDPR